MITKFVARDELIAQLKRYSIAVVAPASVSGVNFIVSLVALSALDPRAFGVFSFMLVALQSLYGVSNAMLCAPYLIAVTGESSSRLVQPADLAANNLLFSGVCGLCGAGAAIAFGHKEAAVPVALYVLLSLMRWFLRNHLYSSQRTNYAAVSDLIFTFSLGIGIAVCWSIGPTFSNIFMAYAVAAGAAVLGQVSETREVLAWPSARHLAAYLPVWRDQARWSLAGVLATDAAANSHSWLVTIMAGPRAYAPIAAASVFYKPISMLGTSLSQLERPVMARAIASGDRQAAFITMKRFRWALMLAFLGNIGTIFLILTFAPEWVMREGYDRSAVLISATLLAIASGLYAWRLPEGNILQAAGQFRLIFFAAITAGVSSVAAVSAILLFAAPVWTILGVVIGNIVFAVRLKIVQQRWAAS